MVKVRPCWPLVRGWRQLTNLGGNLLIVVCVYAHCCRVAAVALSSLHHRRLIVAVALPPLHRHRRRPHHRHPRCCCRHRRRRCRCRLMDVMVKNYPVLAAGARMGGSKINGGGCDCGCGCSTRRIAGTTMWDDAVRPTIEGRLGSVGLLPGVPFFEL